MKEEFKLEKVLESGDTDEIINVIISVAQYGSTEEDYKYALDLCERYYDHSDEGVRGVVRYATQLIAYINNKIDRELFVKIIRHAFDRDEREAEDTYSDVCSSLASKEDRLYIRDQLQEYYEEFKLERCDMKFASDDFIEESLAKVAEGKKKFKSCCKNMRDAIDEKFIECDISTRNYDIIIDRKAFSLKFCPWCGESLGKELLQEWMNILEDEYGLDPIDFTNLTNVPDEFKTDLWWRRRFVVNGVNIAIEDEFMYEGDERKRDMPIHIIPFEDQEDKEYCCSDMKEHTNPESKDHVIEYIPQTRTYILKSYDEKNKARKEISHCPWCSIELSNLNAKAL